MPIPQARLTLGMALLTLMLLEGSPTAQNQACGTRANNTHALLQECVTLDGVREHQAALQAIADASSGTRVSGTSGYDLSADYAEQVLIQAGYAVTRQAFQFQTYIDLAPPLLEQVAPPPAVTLSAQTLDYSGSGDVTAAVTALTAPAADPTPGCDAADFAGFPAGNIALISRGGCTFAIKATNAYNAGATAVVLYNNQAGVINGTLGNGFTLELSVVAVTQADGQQLAATPGLVLHVKTQTFRGLATTYNLLAESRAGDPDNVVMAGAHLDSVNAGPGINDNGSGSAAILEVARQMARVRPRNKVRFALWGAEESGLIGSLHYVNALSQDERDRIALYLNFDMIGSPNAGYFVYDGDDSDGVGAGPGPAGSAQIEKTFEAFYADKGIVVQGSDFSGRSDYGPFIAVGIPSGGVSTGAESLKTAQQAALWGGTAGIAFDPCYHQACDTYANNTATALDVNADAVAFGVLQYAMSTADVNGRKGRGSFKKVPPAPAENEPVVQ
jgi:Zn-dependent M28 family amino/carboxypeptidase